MLKLGVIYGEKRFAYIILTRFFLKVNFIIRFELKSFS